MITGMMWFDNDPKTTLAGKIALAAQYYHRKYGRDPDCVMVNPKAMPADGLRMVGPIRVQAWRGVMPGNLWIGNDEVRV